jgi:hypothetical protein
MSVSLATRKPWRALFAAAAISISSSAGAQQASAPWSPSESEGWSLAWLETKGAAPKVTFKGVANFDAVGVGNAGMLYPAPNLGGLLAAILTHAAIAESTKNGQKEAAQKEADKVLTDYLPTIDAFAPEELIARAIKSAKSWPAGLREPSSTRWTVEVQPLFRMTQDRRALMVDNVLKTRDRGETPHPRAVAVRVVADPQAAESAAALWNSESGETLKAHSALLLAQAVSLSLDELAGRWNATDAPERTVRFVEGGEERIERAQVLDNRCGRAIIRTLRGDLMSVPVRTLSAPTDPGCAAPAVQAASSAAITAPTAATKN